MATEQPGGVDPILAMAETARQSFAPPVVDPVTEERRGRFAGIAKATQEKLSKMGGGLAYIAKHPEILPGIIAKGAVGWGENIAHPVAAPIQALRHKKALTRDELYWTAGLIEGAVETFIIYNTLPPGVARLVRAGISFAVSQAPMLVSYVREANEKGEAYKNITDPTARAAELTAIEQRHTRATGFVKSFCRGRAAAGTYAGIVSLFSASGLVEKGAELALVVTGVKKLVSGGDQQVLELARVNEALSSEDFRNAANVLNSDPDLNQQLVLLDNQTVKEALDGLGLKTENLSDEALEQIKQATITKTNIWSDNHLVEGTREALLVDPQLHVDQAALIGKQHVIDSLQKLKDDPAEYQKFIEERKGIITQALQEEKDRSIVETTPTPTATPTQEAAAQQILQTNEVSKEVEAAINNFANTRGSHKAVRLITNNIARANGFDSWDQVPEGAAKKTLASLEGQLRETYEKEFKQGMVEALAKDPNNIDTALWAGFDKGSKAMYAYMDLPDPPFSAGEKLTPDVQKFVDNVDSAFRKNLLIDRIIAARPDFQVAKAAAVGARLDIIDQEYVQVIREAGIDIEKIPAQTLGAIEKKFHSEFQHSLEAKANEYFDAQAETAIKGGQSLDQAAALGRKQLLGDLDNSTSELRKTLHKEALETLVEVTKAEGKASLVGANLDQVDQATNQAIDKLGISGEISDQTRQAIKTSIQHRAEELVNKSFDQAVEAHKDQTVAITDLLADTKDRFQHDLPGELVKVAVRDAAEQYARAEYFASLDAYQADIDQAAQNAIAKVLKDRAAFNAVISPETVADIKESAHEVIKFQASQNIQPKIHAINFDDPNAEHLHATIKQVVAEGRKGLDSQLAVVDSKSGLKSLQANAEWALNEHLSRDEGIRAQVSKAVAETSQDHISAVKIESGQTVSHIFAQADQALNYTPHDARKLAAFIAINEKELADMHYAFEAKKTIPQDGYFPVTLDSLYDIMVKAENGDEEARRRLMEAVWWIQKGHTLKIMSLADQAKIISILKSGRAPTYIKI